MAQLPLNSFKTKTQWLGTNTTSTVYTAPIGVTSIILMAQIANVTTGTVSVNFQHFRKRQVLQDAQGNGAQPANTATFLVKNFGIPANDAGTPLGGKMIIESLDSIRAWASAPDSLQLVLSVLETANA
jgi:hypothetical protein